MGDKLQQIIRRAGFRSLPDTLTKKCLQRKRLSRMTVRQSVEYSRIVKWRRRERDFLARLNLPSRVGLGSVLFLSLMKMLLLMMINWMIVGLMRKLPLMMKKMREQQEVDHLLVNWETLSVWQDIAVKMRSYIQIIDLFDIFVSLCWLMIL